MIESVVRRVFGALEVVDSSTGLPLTRPLRVHADNARLVRNRSGLYVITHVNGTYDYARGFDPVPPMAPTAVNVRLSDPARRYLPAQTAINLPRDANPNTSDILGSVFRPVRVSLYPTPNYSVFPGAAMVRVTVVAEGSNERLGGAVVRVLRDVDGDDEMEVIGRGLTAWQGRILGEALVPLFGIPAAAADTEDNGGPRGGPGSGSVIITEFSASVEVIFDPDFDPDNDIPDLDDIESRQDSLPGAAMDITIASGRETTVRVAVEIP